MIKKREKLADDTDKKSISRIFNFRDFRVSKLAQIVKCALWPPDCNPTRANLDLLRFGKSKSKLLQEPAFVA